MGGIVRYWAVLGGIGRYDCKAGLFTCHTCLLVCDKGGVMHYSKKDSSPGET